MIDPSAPPERSFCQMRSFKRQRFRQFDGQLTAEAGLFCFLDQVLRFFAASPISASSWSARGETETGLMKAIKAALDPKNIMNPGKVI